LRYFPFLGEQGRVQLRRRMVAPGRRYHGGTFISEQAPAQLNAALMFVVDGVTVKNASDG